MAAKATQTKRPTIYSVGYSKQKPAYIAELAEALRATVLDVRGNPMSRVAGFGRLQLQALLGARYKWVGRDGLGNRPPTITVTSAGITSLTKLDRPVILMCKCYSPGECHRHNLIAVPLLKKGIDVRHIYQGVVFKASDLDNESIAEDDLPYDDLAAVMARGGYDAVQAEPDEPAEPARPPGPSQWSADIRAAIAKKLEYITLQRADEGELGPWSDSVEYAEAFISAYGLEFVSLTQQPVKLECIDRVADTRLTFAYDVIRGEVVVKEQIEHRPAKSSQPAAERVIAKRRIKPDFLF